MIAPRKLLVVQLAAFSADIAARMKRVPAGLTWRKAQAVFPAVTCTAQASFRTGALPDRHGMIANGTYQDRLKKILFWEQAASLVSGERIWSDFREQGGKVGLLFWQQSLGESADVIVSPRPIHKHSGGMIQDVYTEPRDLYARLCEKVGRKFNLMHYWGPLASRKSSEWIVDATRALMSMPDIAPDLLLTYLPHLDYDLQRYGTDHAKINRAIGELERFLERLCSHAKANGYEVLVFGDYAIQTVEHGALFPNGALRNANLFLTQNVKGMAYPDFFASKAFAMVDHEIAHVYVPDRTMWDRAREVVSDIRGVAEVLDREAQKARGIDHPNSGDFVMVAEDGYWFAYPWWGDKAEAPDFAGHVDIHNKPGFDPCELFFGWPPGSVSMDATKVGGSHGRVGPDREIAWASTAAEFPDDVQDVAALGRAVGEWLGQD